MNGRAILTTGLMVISVLAFGQSVQPGWIVDARTGCKVRDANPQPNESIKWSGGCRNKLAQRRGVLRWFQCGKPAALVRGRWWDGKMNGHGVVTLTEAPSRANMSTSALPVPVPAPVTHTTLPTNAHFIPPVRIVDRMVSPPWRQPIVEAATGSAHLLSPRDPATPPVLERTWWRLF